MGIRGAVLKSCYRNGGFDDSLTAVQICLTGSPSLYPYRSYNPSCIG